MAAQSPFSSSITCRWTYDVFLNFRGEDTRFDFAKNLYVALDQRGIHTFMDDEGLRKGEEITPSLVKAIQESRIAITIFSKNYASSTFCLDELVHILEYIKKKGRLVLPIFYDVDPSEVRHQRENYGEAFRKHEKRSENDKEKVKKWRLALQEAAGISGHHLKPGQQYERDYIDRIVKEVSTVINHLPLHVADYPVGLESRVPKVISLLDVGSNERVMVGIWGAGGIGKSTIARKVFNSLTAASLFEGFCFLSDVRENSTKHGLAYLQNMLLSDVLGEDNVNLRDAKRGIQIIQHKLCKKKVLLVLDDVDNLNQLRGIAGAVDWFGPGSRIIITTRNKHLLETHGVERIYMVESLNHEEALELLKCNAFKENRVDPSFLDSLNKLACYACGLPLALEIIGSNLFSRGINHWNSAVDNYRRIPNQQIQQVLKISFDALEESEKEIFLDIACCFKGDTLENVKSALSACGRCPDSVINELIDRCFIKIVGGFVTMHDLIQDMGKEIVRQQSPNHPGKRSRLWSHEDIRQVLEESEGTEEIEAINLDMPRDEDHQEIGWDGRAFEKMQNLKLLIVRNAQFSRGPEHLPNGLRVLDWKEYPCASFPADFNPKKLIILKIPESFLEVNAITIKRFRSVSLMDFSRCKFLRQLPDFSEFPNLMELCLDDCENLIEVHVSNGFPDKLKRLSLRRCCELMTFPSILSRSLEFFDLTGCSSLKTFPEILEKMENIREVLLDHCGIEELPLSFGNLIGLRFLKLSECFSLREVRAIPPNLSKLDARDKDLTSDSCRILLSQAKCEINGLTFVFKGEWIPQCLDYYARKDHSISFWIRNKLPNICVTRVVTGDVYSSPGLRVYVNMRMLKCEFASIIYRKMTLGNITLFDLRSVVPEDELKSVVLEHEWNYVMISGGSSSELKGIYVYKQDFKMEDISFTKPLTDRRFPGSSKNHNNTCADQLVLRRSKWPHIDMKSSANKAGISLLFEP